MSSKEEERQTSAVLQQCFRPTKADIIGQKVPQIKPWHRHAEVD
jgi:hypothetical protein